MALSEQRQRLADRLAELASLTREREQLSAASAPAWGAIRDAADALERARADTEQVGRAAIDHRIMSLAGQSDLLPPSIEQARARTRDAEDALNTLRAAAAEIETRTRGLDRALRTVQDNVEREAKLVLWSEAQEPLRSIVAQARAAQRAYVEQAAIAKFLHALAPWPYPEHDLDAMALRHLVWELEIVPLQWSSAKGGPDPTEGWQAALAALQADASAKLPR